MDSLLYIGAADDDEEGSDGEEEAGPAASSGAAASLDYAALQRAGYDGTSADLSQTATYKRLDAEAKQKLEQDATVKEEKEAAAAAVEEARLAAERALLNTKAIDEKLGYEKRFDKTKEDFRTKEKRKRATGQQSSSGDYVQEEKRRLRHGMTGNYDS